MEMLISSILLGTVMVVLIQAIGLATRFSSQAHREAQGLQFLETVFVKLKAGAIPMNEDSDGDFEEEGFAQIRYEVTSESYAEDQALHKVTVSVFWPAGAGENSLEGTRLMMDTSAEEEDR